MEMSYIFANENSTSSSVSNLKGIFRAEKGIRNEEFFLRAATIPYRAATPKKDVSNAKRRL